MSPPIGRDSSPTERPAPGRRNTKRPGFAVAAAVVGLLAAVVVVLVVGASSGPGAHDVTREAARDSDIPHHYEPTYTGPVWFRVIPTAAHVGEDHRVRLRWGPKQNSFTLDRLGSSARTLVLQKTGTDDTTFLVKVDPPARVEFSEGQPDSDAQSVPSGWTQRTSG